MKLKIFSEDSLISIKTNTEHIYKNFLKKGNAAIEEYIQGEGVLLETSFDLDDFDLDTSQTKSSLTDLENIKRVYKHVRFLSESQASDERMWASLCFGRYSEYMKYRWPAENANDMANHYLFNYSIQRSLFRNGISRLWWMGKITYDQNRTDPYELTQFVCTDTDYMESVFGRNFTKNPSVMRGMLSALLDAQKSGIKIDRFTVREISKYINILGGTYILDCLSYDDIYSKVAAKLSAGK